MSTMVEPKMQPTTAGTSLADGVRFADAHEPGVFLDIMPQDPSGNVEVEVCVEEDGAEMVGHYATLSPEQRRTAAAVLLGMNERPHGHGQPVQEPGKMRVVMETGGDDWTMTAEDFDYMWARAGWHVRNGIPGFIQHASGSKVSIHEVGEGDTPPRGMSEARRHYRYKLPGDRPGEWRYHNNFNHIRQLKPLLVEMQRSYRSEWSEV